MSHRSSIYCIPSDEAPKWPPGVRTDHVYATRRDRPIPPEVTGTADSWHVIHCAPGVVPPLNVASIVIEGHVTPWTVEMVAGGWPNGSPYVMEVTWLDDGPMGTQARRGKTIDLPKGKTPTATMLPPHRWAGDGSGSLITNEN